MFNNCIVCGYQYFIEIPEITNFKFVSSDCKLSEFNSLIKVCKYCGHIQKEIDEEWLGNVKKIYSGYAPYSLSQGRDQLVFDGSGAQNHRSRYILKQFLSDHPLPHRGKILDVGCGNGELLAAFNSLRPEWDLAGFEIEEHQREKIMEKKKGTLFYSGDINNITGEFDLITLFNVFEHVIDPNLLLSNLRSKLKNNGMLLIYAPNIRISLFDLLVFDHCSHFEQKTMDFILKKNGFQGTFYAYHPYDRYLFAAANKQSGNQEVFSYECDALTCAQFVREQVAWLGGIPDQARAHDTCGGMGVFGTTIAATWIAGMLRGSVGFFVDEDAVKEGKIHQGKPIIHPKNITEESKVFLAFIPQEAAAIKERLEREYKKIEFIAPNLS